MDDKVDRISYLIQSISGSDEDVFQESWLKIVESKVSSDDEILKITKDIKRKSRNNNIRENYSVMSIDKPLNGEEDDFTLHDILVADEIQEDVAPRKHRVNGNGNVKGWVRLDTETLDAIKEKYNGMPLNRAVRLMIGLPPLDKISIWQEWEDDIIRDRYPWGGSLAVSVDVKRAFQSIRQRARILGIRRDIYRPSEKWVTSSELANMLRCSVTNIFNLVKSNKITRINAPGKRYGFGFFEQKSIVTFLKDYPFSYDHNKVSDELVPYIPKWVFEWVPLKHATSDLYMSTRGLHKVIKRNKSLGRIGYKGILYIHLKNTKHYINK